MQWPRFQFSHGHLTFRFSLRDTFPPPDNHGIYVLSRILPFGTFTDGIIGRSTRCFLYFSVPTPLAVSARCDGFLVIIRHAIPTTLALRILRPLTFLIVPAVSRKLFSGGTGWALYTVCSVKVLVIIAHTADSLQ